MSLLTEAELRLRLRTEDLDALKEYRVEAGTIVTPSAKAYLSDHKIELVVGDKKVLSAPGASKTPEPVGKTRSPEPAHEGNLPAFTPPHRYESAAGGYFDEKPEHMTALRGTKLVNKDHKIIRFRGEIDDLQAHILTAQFALTRLGHRDAAEGLREVLSYTGEILRCEVLDKVLEDQTLLGMDSDEIRARSHTPKKYYGLPHFAASYDHGEGVAVLNALRTQVRKVELVAYNTFKDEYGVPVRIDIIRALNRLSSLFYVMMFRLLAEEK